MVEPLHRGVAPDGTQTRANIGSLRLGPMQNLVHLIEDRASGRVAVVDPAWEAGAILAVGGRAAITDVLITHWHEDHTNALDELLEATRATVHALGVETDYWEVTTPVERHADGDRIRLGATEIRVLHTPGHSPGSACYAIPGELFTGDTLFVYGCGRCDLPGGDAGALFHSLRRLQAQLPPDTRVHPGHDYANVRVTTLGEQTRANPFLHRDSVEDFAAFRAEHNRHRQPPYRPVLRGEPAW